jgi:hypothetical protein
MIPPAPPEADTSVTNTATTQLQPILGKRAMGGKTTNYFLVRTRDNTTQWQQTPTAIRSINGKQLEYFICLPNMTHTWLTFDKVPLLPCPGIINQSITITAEQRRRAQLNRARALQHQKNVEIARSIAAHQQDQRQAAASHPTPDLEAATAEEAATTNRKRATEDQFLEHAVANAPKRFCRAAAAPTDERAFTQQHNFEPADDKALACQRPAQSINYHNSITEKEGNQPCDPTPSFRQPVGGAWEGISNMLY